MVMSDQFKIAGEDFKVISYHINSKYILDEPIEMVSL